MLHLDYRWLFIVLAFLTACTEGEPELPPEPEPEPAPAPVEEEPAPPIMVEDRADPVRTLVIGEWEKTRPVPGDGWLEDYGSLAEPCVPTEDTFLFPVLETYLGHRSAHAPREVLGGSPSTGQFGRAFDQLPAFQDFIQDAVDDGAFFDYEFHKRTEFGRAVGVPFDAELSGCADGYVRKVRYGTMIMFGVRVLFLDEEQRQEFIAAHGDDAIYEILNGDRAVLARDLQGASVSVYATQIGAHPETLAEVTSELGCSAEALDRCAHAIRTLRWYRDEVYQANLLNLPVGGADPVADGWAVLAYTVERSSPP